MNRLRTILFILAILVISSSSTLASDESQRAITVNGEGKASALGLVYVDSLQHAHAFTEDDLRVLTALANVAAAKIENVRLLEESLEKRRMEEDMRMAAEIQNGLLPREAPGVPGWDLAGCNRPCRTVGGDYYDFAVEDGRLLLALGGVSGKGTGAARAMTVLAPAGGARGGAGRRGGSGRP